MIDSNDDKTLIHFNADGDFHMVDVGAKQATERTGVEMEALTGIQVALLTIYDMCKAVGSLHGDGRYPAGTQIQWRNRGMEPRRLNIKLEQ